MITKEFKFKNGDEVVVFPQKHEEDAQYLAELFCELLNNRHKFTESAENAHTTELVSEELVSYQDYEDLEPSEVAALANERHAERCKEVAKAAWLEATGRYTDFDPAAEDEFEEWYNETHEKWNT